MSEEKWSPFSHHWADNQPLWPDLRYRRAEVLTSAILQIADKYIEDREERNLRRFAHDLLQLFYISGVEVVTDHERKIADLPPRGEKGLTRYELQILENRRIEALLSPLPPMIIPTEKR